MGLDCGENRLLLSARVYFISNRVRTTQNHRNNYLNSSINGRIREMWLLGCSREEIAWQIRSGGSPVLAVTEERRDPFIKSFQSLVVCGDVESHFRFDWTFVVPEQSQCFILYVGKQFVPLCGSKSVNFLEFL